LFRFAFLAGGRSMPPFPRRHLRRCLHSKFSPPPPAPSSPSRVFPSPPPRWGSATTRVSRVASSGVSAPSRTVSRRNRASVSPTVPVSRFPTWRPCVRPCARRDRRRRGCRARSRRSRRRRRRRRRRATAGTFSPSLGLPRPPAEPVSPPPLSPPRPSRACSWKISTASSSPFCLLLGFLCDEVELLIIL